MPYWSVCHMLFHIPWKGTDSTSQWKWRQRICGQVGFSRQGFTGASAASRGEQVCLLVCLSAIRMVSCLKIVSLLLICIWGETNLLSMLILWYVDMHIYIKRKRNRNWLMWSWKPRNPIICHLQAGNPGQSVVCNSALAWRPQNQEYQFPRQEKMDASESGICPFSFSSIQALQGLGDAHLQWGGPSTLFSLLIQMLISSKKTFTDNTRFYQLPGHPLAESIAHKVNYHNGV